MSLPGFKMELTVDRRPLRTVKYSGTTYALAAPGKAFEVAISHSNSSTYMARLSVDGVEAEPGYVKKIRPGETTRFTGYLCRRDVHEFLFADTPVDDTAPPGSASESAQRLGTVAATIYATRRVRVEDSSSDEDYGHRSSSAIPVTRLPEKQAVKDYGVQARAGGYIERVPRYRRRRRGDYRLEKVKPEVATLTVCYRDEMWWSRHGLLDRKDGGGSARRSEAKPAPAPEATPAAPPLKIKREPGETARGPDGKRRYTSGAARALAGPARAALSARVLAEGRSSSLARRAPGPGANAMPPHRRRKLASAAEANEVIELSD